MGVVVERADKSWGGRYIIDSTHVHCLCITPVTLTLHTDTMAPYVASWG